MFEAHEPIRYLSSRPRLARWSTRSLSFPPITGSPMPNATQSQIKNRISEFVQELDLLVRRSTLEALQGVLADGAKPARRGPGRPAGARPGPRGRRPADLGDATAKIVDYVKANDGQGISAVAN